MKYTNYFMNKKKLQKKIFVQYSLLVIWLMILKFDMDVFRYSCCIWQMFDQSHNKTISSQRTAIIFNFKMKNPSKNPNDH